MLLPKYKKRTLTQMKRTMTKAIRDLCLRNWNIDFEYGDNRPKHVGPESDRNRGTAMIWKDELHALIWVNEGQCKEDNTDPLWVLKHELGHIWIADRQSEEVRASLIAYLL